MKEQKGEQKEQDGGECEWQRRTVAGRHCM